MHLLSLLNQNKVSVLDNVIISALTDETISRIPDGKLNIVGDNPELKKLIQEIKKEKKKKN